MIDLSVWKGKTLAVMGLGKTGASAVDALLAAGVNVFAWDDQDEGRAKLKHQDVLVDLREVDFGTVDALILSPGIPHSFPKPHPVAQKAIDSLVPIYCDIELLARACPDIPQITITGTNGKSTTTALIGHVMAADRKVETGGNLGKPVLTFKTRGVKAFVLELSSYQLERTPSLTPNVAVWLNITPDHIDRHGDLAGYIAAKKMMFRKPSAGCVAVIGVDDEYSRKVADDLEAAGQWIVRRVSVHKPLASGYFVRDGNLVFKSAEGEKICMDLRSLPKLKGIHNWQNAACAWAACAAAGVDEAVLVEKMRDFPGLAHRQYVVDVINGIAYVNDSKATNANATSMALRSFDNIYWIVGGLPKEGGLNGLDEYMVRVRHAFLIGQAQEDFAQWLESRGVAHSICGTMDVAVRDAHELAQGERGLPGGGAVVLLSPACASFDQFPNYEVRGDHFASLVADLPREDA